MAKAKGYEEISKTTPPQSTSNAEGTGISILMVPDTTYRVLSDEAAKRNMTVSELVSVAVSSYLMGVEKTSEDPPMPAVRPVMKGWK